MMSAPNSPKTKSGVNGKFLPRPQHERSHLEYSFEHRLTEDCLA